jgi:hypothetical protein
VKGDVSLTFEIETGAAATVFVSHPRTGRAVDDQDGRVPRTTGTAARERTGGDVQESNGNLGRGRTGKVN